ncbi:response regulator [Sulfurimonas aquatica]|uniref:Response regulator n=1 Tax=Sulfurimonas aquatica TaxID=2672570 RepID=A0A975B0S0_9BACT|nr:response regulator [Sulfurimonas aquatica]QSZ42028.1 response regulator [Sulfurimonas aquatica]
MKEMIENIKELTTGMTLLYVEDNAGLRENMSKLLTKIFANVILAQDGEEGYKSFFKHRPNIIITDINMPNMNGFKMIRKIREAEPEAKVIILSAHDEKKHLHIAIELGVFRYLHKPAKLPELVKTIHRAVTSIHKEEQRRIFLSQMQSIFNYQNNIVVMMNKEKFTLTNQRFLEFFDVDDLEDFNKKYKDMDSLLLKHDEFLYTNEKLNWQQSAMSNPGTLFHTKIKNSKNEMRHLILKSREVPNKTGFYVLSFDDVTELNLMGLFDKNSTMDDKALQDKNSILSFMKLVKDNSSEVKIHNFYKGLTIINPAVISKLTEDEISFKTAYSQLKIVQLTKFMTISSEAFPKSIICKSIKSVDADKQTIVINDFQFTHRSSADREHIRLEAGKKERCTLFYKDIKFIGDVKIVDLSEVSAKISVDALVPGLGLESKLKLSMNLPVSRSQISITTDTTVYRIDENVRTFYLVLLFDLNTKEKDNMKAYIANRQMELIREFKQLNIL